MNVQYRLLRGAPTLLSIRLGTHPAAATALKSTGYFGSGPK